MEGDRGALKPVISEHYTRSFYERQTDGATRSAEVIVPLVLQLLPVRSVVDIGCGVGSWLSVFRKLGIDDICGIDGDYVDQDLLQIPPDRFQSFDLRKPFSLGRVFDLAVSLEVAEHLPADCAAVFVDCLTHLAPFVLFSAAIPFQGGTHHLNEQWPDNWAGLFKEHDYLPVDFIRKRVWQNDGVSWWYAQNTLLFARADLVKSNAALGAEFEKTNPNQLSLVHPRQYLDLETVLRSQQPSPPSGVRAASRALLVCLRNAITRRFSLKMKKETHP
jgi:SAM-dependent methyltransferase